MIFSGQGMKPDPIKIQALQDLTTPQNQNQLQSFLGLVNYLQPFLPDIAGKTTFLREQISQWDWTPSTDSTFQLLKQWICKTLLKITLTYYDRTQPLTLYTDASKYGLGAVLLQNDRPIAFASKTLTNMETRYTNIERECLSVVFGLGKFHTYIYGRQITVYNDHKPLEKAHPHSTSKFTKNASSITEVWLHTPVQTRKGNDFGWQVKSISFMQRECTNRITSKHLTSDLHSRQD